jgi:hypothetical protein
MPTGPNYTCDEVNNLFLAESGRFGPNIAKKAIPAGPWLSPAVVPSGEWQDGMGLIHNSLVWERTLPSNDGDEWTDNAVSDGTNDQCNLTPEELVFGQTSRAFKRQSREITTPWICLEDLRDDYNIGRFLDAMKGNLGQVSEFVWQNRNQDEWIRLAEHKVTENGSFNMEATSFDAARPPTSRLTNGTLDQIYQYIIANGGAVDGSIGTTDGGNPVLPLFTDFNTDRDLIRQDPELRADFRYAMPDALIKSFGVARSWNNFKHVFNPYQPRYEISGGNYVRVQQFKDPAATTKGFKREINPAYLYATYALHIIAVPIYTRRVPKPLTSPGGGVKFDPVNYMGVFEWMNIRDVKCNRHGNKGFFDALFVSASDPGPTWHGFAIMALNCPPVRLLKPSCYS